MNDKHIKQGNSVYIYMIKIKNNTHEHINHKKYDGYIFI